MYLMNDCLSNGYLIEIFIINKGDFHDIKS